MSREQILREFYLNPDYQGFTPFRTDSIENMADALLATRAQLAAAETREALLSAQKAAWIERAQAAEAALVCEKSETGLHFCPCCDQHISTRNESADAPL